MLAGLVNSETSLLSLQMAAVLLSPHMAFPLCIRIFGVSSTSYDTSPIGLQSHSYNLI